jgi:hypothetical protein
LLNTITDAIRGFSIDLLSPIVDAIVPGSIKTPVEVAGVRIYPTRFIIRLVNVAVAFTIVRYAIQRKNNYM